MTNSNSREPISIAARVNIQCFFKKDIQHIIFWGRLSGKIVCDHCERARKQNLEEINA